MQFIDLPGQQKRIRAQIEKRIMTVLDHGKYIMGPEVKELEKVLAEYVGVKHCITCSSGTDALLMGLMALGVGRGDGIVVPTFTFVATAEVVSLLGATPIFADVDPDTFNLDVEKLPGVINQAREQGVNPKGIIPVDLFGLPADYDRIEAIAKENDMFILEDACQGFGGEYKGKKLCSFGEAGATSFFPAKPLGCYGDGGAVFTDDDDIADRLESIRVHGKGTDKYNNIRIGMNGRMDTIQAAILLEKMAIFPEEVELRQKVAAGYTDGLKGHIKTPLIPDGYKSAYAQYTLQSDAVEKIRPALQEAGIPTQVYYPLPLHLQTAYAEIGCKEGDFPVSEKLSKTVFSLPMHPYLTEEEINTVTKTVISVAD